MCQKLCVLGVTFCLFVWWWGPFEQRYQCHTVVTCPKFTILLNGERIKSLSCSSQAECGPFHMSSTRHHPAKRCEEQGWYEPVGVTVNTRSFYGLFFSPFHTEIAEYFLWHSHVSCPLLILFAQYPSKFLVEHTHLEMWTNAYSMCIRRIIIVVAVVCYFGWHSVFVAG